MPREKQDYARILNTPLVLYYQSIDEMYTSQPNYGTLHIGLST
jgi:hypothetical protein